MPVRHAPNPRGVYEEIMDTLHNETYRLVPDDALLRTRAQVALHEIALRMAEESNRPVTTTLIRGMRLEEVDQNELGLKEMRVQNMGCEITMGYLAKSSRNPPISYEVKDFELNNVVMKWTDDGGREWKVPLQTILRVN